VGSYHIIFLVDDGSPYFQGQKKALNLRLGNFNWQSWVSEDTSYPLVESG
jgi:hypothetical protein